MKKKSLTERIKETDWQMIGLGALGIASIYSVSELGEWGAELMKDQNALEYIGLKGGEYFAKGVTVIATAQYLANIITGKYSKRVNHA